MIIALMMEAGRTSETLVNFYRTTRRYNPEDSHLQSKGCLLPDQKEKRGIGRPKMRWRDSVDQDAEALGGRNWRRLSMDKKEWKKLLRKARSHIGL
jgi:hypothetical protein